MRLLGASMIKVVPEMVDASSIGSHIVAVPCTLAVCGEISPFCLSNTDTLISVDEAMKQAYNFCHRSALNTYIVHNTYM